MGKRVSVVQIREMVRKAVEHNRAFIKAMETSENPQIQVMVTEARGEAEAFASVFDALNGDNVFLKIHIGEVQ